MPIQKGSIAIMCDVERMFHQFHVIKEHQDYLRFLWWDKGDLNSKPSVYRMRVHLFGAASSPGCCNFGLKHLAAQGREKFSKETIQFIQRGFYVDDGLASVTSTAEAIQLVEESRALCKTGNLRLHKFVSNSKEVLAAIPEAEQAQAKDQDMALGETHIERALGVQWCIEADEFQSESDLPKLAALKIPRSYSKNIDIARYELHNFSDASLNGYGACSYLRAISKEGQITCSLVMGKARVTPTKQTTIPRLELSSAVTSVRNADVIKRELEIGESSRVLLD
ncbi:hypothetical protein WMY93_024180 [Mugilogobius chulae]|uniref:Reverse transcriptase domain-containing protein n=1 Tax=Mugilogobius chulae TaxID=88201 RepID=A0AAW0N977_9GOBI